MKFSRRHFFKLGGVASAGILGFGSFAFGQNKSFFNDGILSSLRADPLFRITAADFRNNVGTEFLLTMGDSPIAATLTEVKSSAAPGSKAARNKGAECFSLTFRLPADAEQATYSASHRSLGKFDLFLVPGKSVQNEPLLHAVINRI